MSGQESEPVPVLDLAGGFFFARELSVEASLQWGQRGRNSGAYHKEMEHAEQVAKVWEIYIGYVLASLESKRMRFVCTLSFGNF